MLQKGKRSNVHYLDLWNENTPTDKSVTHMVSRMRHNYPNYGNYYRNCKKIIHNTIILN